MSLLAESTAVSPTVKTIGTLPENTPSIERDRSPPRRVKLPPFIVPRVEEALAPMPDVLGWLNHGKPLTPPTGNRSPIYLGLKRLLDVVGAVACLILFAPI